MPKKKTDTGEFPLRSPLNEASVAGLYEPFPPEKIKKRKGKAGREYDYVESQEIIHRLNQIFGLRWGIKELQSEFIGSPPNYVVKLIELEVPDPDNPTKTWTRIGWGGHPLTDNRGQYQDIGDAMKSAQSKALTKAASQLGVGLHLWGIDSHESVAGTEDVPLPWEGPSQFPTQPPVAVINPGPHNAPPQGVPSVPVYPGSYETQPQLNNPGAVPPPYVPQGQPYQGAPPLPQMTNPNVGYSDGSGGPVAAQMAFQTAPPATGNSIVEFQIHAIRGAAAAQGLNPMQLAFQVLGQEVAGFQVIEELNFDQAVKVLEYIRSNMQPAY
jgi:hypothetical protein